MTIGPLDTVIIGVGHAGRSFHLPAVLDLAASGYGSGIVTVVDPALARGEPGLPPGVTVRRELGPPVSDHVVVHVCTGPDSHGEVVASASQLGYRWFIVEKPMTTTLADARRLLALSERGMADILVVSNWTASVLSQAIRRVMRRKASVPLHDVVLTQVKPRLQRTMASTTHQSAFDVEMPHLVALAMYLAEEPLAVVDAACTDLVVGARRYPAMGSARITLTTASGVPLRLRSDLTAPVRERSTIVTWADGSKLAGFHPCDSTDMYAQMFTWSPAGACLGREFFYDDTVRGFLRAAYAHFAGTGSKPASDVRFGADVTALISTARARAVVTEHRSEDLAEDWEIVHAAAIPD